MSRVGFAGFVVLFFCGILGMVVFAQMFLSDALIPVNKSSGLLGALAHAMPITYLIDLLRDLVYQGAPFYSQISMYNPVLDLVIIAAISIASFVIGTFLFVRSERNR